MIELTNLAANTLDTFAAEWAETTHPDLVAATWHTHPNGSANLSVADWKTFVSYPGMEHIVIGTDGVRFYGVHNGAVINLKGPEA